MSSRYLGFPGADAEGPVTMVKDLRFQSSSHTITPKLELGVFTDLWLSLEMPIVVRDSRNLRFDQRASPCVFPGEGEALYTPLRFLRYGLLGLWISLGAPWLFTRIRLAEPATQTA